LFLPLLARNPASLVGIAVATTTAILFLVFLLLELFGLLANPYLGLLLFVAIPAVFTLGLLLIPIGMWWTARRTRRGAAAPEWPVIDLRTPRHQSVVLAILALTAANVVLISMAAYGGVHYMETAEFCGRVCHTTMEPQYAAYQAVELNDETVDPEVWGKNFPLQYDGYKRTVDQVRTRYGGSEAVPRTPTGTDPRGIVAQSRLEEDPRLKTMWAGYAFAKDFREERGHAYMLEDQTFTERQVVVQQPGTCMHCHASVYVPYKKLGGGDLIKGFERMNQMKSSRCGIRACMRAPASRVPTVTCPTSESAR
jgi:hypothetical protein